jgi:hypothetical protein
MVDKRRKRGKRTKRVQKKMRGGFMEPVNIPTGPITFVEPTRPFTRRSSVTKRNIKKKRYNSSKKKKNKKTTKRTNMNGGSLNKLKKKIMGDPIKVGDTITSRSEVGSGKKYLLDMNGQQRHVTDGGAGRFKVIGIEKRGKFGHRKKYLLLEKNLKNLKILEENAKKYVAPPPPLPSSMPQIIKNLPEDSVTEYMKNFH